MKLGIVIPALNESRNLSCLLPFLRKYSDPEKVQIVVSDGAGSTDDSATLCERYGVLHVRNTVDQRARQLNSGAAILDCDVLLFLHADVYPPCNFYNEVETAIREGAEFGLFAYRFNSKKKLLGINAWATQFQGLFCGGGDQCHFMTVSFFETMGGYDERFDIMEDFAFYRKALKRKPEFKLIQSKALVSARKYDHNSFLWVNLVNLYAFILFLAGAHPSRIKNMYQSSLSWE